MITTKQRAFLQGLGNALEPAMQIGKDGVGENTITSVLQLLEARELVKFKVLNNYDGDVRMVANTIATDVGADVVQCIGKIFILYKKTTKKGFKHIELP